MALDMHDRQSLTARVYDHIHEGILEGRYKDGDFLVETKLAEELEVSRTPIREALKQLELEGLAVSIPNRGVKVQAISTRDIDDIYTIRRLLEGQAAYWAAERITEEQLANLGETLGLMEFYTGRGDAARLSRLDGEFHEQIYAACNSRMLKHILGTLHQNIRRARRSSLTVPSRPRDSLAEHKAIYDAIEGRSAEVAKAAMEQHVVNAHSAAQ